MGCCFIDFVNCLNKSDIHLAKSKAAISIFSELTDVILRRFQHYCAVNDQMRCHFCSCGQCQSAMCSNSWMADALFLGRASDLSLGFFSYVDALLMLGLSGLVRKYRLLTIRAGI